MFYERISDFFAAEGDFEENLEPATRALSEAEHAAVMAGEPVAGLMLVAGAGFRVKA